MNNQNLSQDAQWALRERKRLRPASRRNWFLLIAVVAVLMALSATFIGNCDRVTAPDLSGKVYQCSAYPYVRIVTERYDSQGYAYFKLIVNSEITECRAGLGVLTTVMADGHWKQIEDGEIQFGPPPPSWDNVKPDTQMGVRINGSASMPIATLTPLPSDNAITIIGKDAE
jgi:hypothetical protein